MSNEKLAAALELLRWGKDDLANAERLRWKRRVDEFLSAEADAVLNALRPFADAARKAEISGQPVFNFVDAGDYERAAALVPRERTP